MEVLYWPFTLRKPFCIENPFHCFAKVTCTAVLKRAIQRVMNFTQRSYFTDLTESCQTAQTRTRAVQIRTTKTPTSLRTSNNISLPGPCMPLKAWHHNLSLAIKFNSLWSRIGNSKPQDVCMWQKAFGQQVWKSEIMYFEL